MNSPPAAASRIPRPTDEMIKRWVVFALLAIMMCASPILMGWYSVGQGLYLVGCCLGGLTANWFFDVLRALLGKKPEAHAPADEYKGN